MLLNISTIYLICTPTNPLCILLVYKVNWDNIVKHMEETNVILETFEIIWKYSSSPVSCKNQAEKQASGTGCGGWGPCK